MAIKVGRAVLRSIFVGGGPMVLIIPPLFMILIILMFSAFLTTPEYFVNEELTEEQQKIKDSYLGSRLFLLVILPILMIVFLLPNINGGIGMNVGTIIKTANIEKRMEKLKKLGSAQFVSQTKARLVSSSPRGNKLYESLTIIPDKKVQFLIYNDKSTDREYISFVPARFDSADQAMAWKFSLSSFEYEKLKVENEA